VQQQWQQSTLPLVDFTLIIATPCEIPSAAVAAAWLCAAALSVQQQRVGVSRVVGNHHATTTLLLLPEPEQQTHPRTAAAAATNTTIPQMHA
jgi:hypothetical protein